MFLKFKKGKQAKFIIQAIIKAGSERKLAKIIGIPKGTIYGYKFEVNNISDVRFKIILGFLGDPYSKYRQHIIKELPSNWGKVKGGINCVVKKKQDGTFRETIEKLRKVSSKRMKNWHDQMKRDYPKEYHIWQYERFKKVGRGYTYHLKNQIPVRNKLERKIGNFLISEGINFEYEPYLNVGGKAYFPDFKTNNIVIEVTEWMHPSSKKLAYLNKKIKDYKFNSMVVIMFIPPNIRKFYKEIDGYCNITSTLQDLKELLNASVA